MRWPTLDAPLTKLGTRLDELRQAVYFADSVAISPQLSGTGNAAMARAMCFVAACAALERFVTDSLDAILQQVTVSVPARRQVRLSLLAMSSAPEFDSLIAVRRLKMWEARATLLESVDATDPPHFPAGVHPLDGATLRHTHFETIWLVFGFPSNPLPNPRHAGVLLGLAEDRNAIAHGDEDPITVGRRKTRQDVLSMIDSVEDVGLHLHMAAVDYLDNNRYVR